MKPEYLTPALTYRSASLECPACEGQARMSMLVAELLNRNQLLRYALEQARGRLEENQCAVSTAFLADD